MKTYLFDTNIWSKWFRNEPSITQKIAQIDEASKIYLSSVVLGEAIYGAKSNKDFEFDLYREFIYKPNPILLPIDEHTADVYGGLRASLFEKYIRKGKNKRPEQLIDPVTAAEIGIDENDLWIVAQAITHNLTLITNDKMHRIFAITPKEFKPEIW